MDSNPVNGFLTTLLIAMAIGYMGAKLIVGLTG